MFKYIDFKELQTGAIKHITGIQSVTVHTTDQQEILVEDAMMLSNLINNKDIASIVINQNEQFFPYQYYRIVSMAE